MTAVDIEAPARWSSARRAWLITMVAALVVAVVCAFLTVDRVREVADGPTFSIPGEATVPLDAGRYVLYEHSSFKGDTSFGPSDVEITGANEDHPTPRTVTGRQTITFSGDVYSGAAEFSVPSAGRYTIAVTGSDRGEVLVARPITDTLTRVAIFAVPALLAGILGVVGLVVVLVNPWARRGPSRPMGPPTGIGWQPAPPAGMASPGWYADPWREAALRWWDGAAWSGHTTDGPPS